MADNKPKIIGRKITEYQTPGVDPKSGLYKAKNYGEARKYQPKPYDMSKKQKDYKTKEFKLITLDNSHHNDYKLKTYNHYYEYNPDYNGEVERPKPKPKPKPQTPKPKTPAPTPKPFTPKAKTPIPTPKEMVFPKGIHPLPSIKRQLYLFRMREGTPQP